MNHATLQLISKEWHEQRGRMAAATAVLVSIPIGQALCSNILDLGIALEWALFIGAIIMPIFIAMGTVAREREQGSLASLLALPISPWRILAVKATVGIITCLVPIAAVLAVTELLNSCMHKDGSYPLPQDTVSMAILAALGR